MTCNRLTDPRLSADSPQVQVDSRLCRPTAERDCDNDTTKCYANRRNSENISKVRKCKHSINRNGKLGST